MQTKNRTKARLILGICLAATVLLLLIGYSVQTPRVKRQEFPFSITYSYQGATETISGVYVAEYIPSAKYIDDHQIAWSGYIQDRSRLESDYYKIAEADGRSFSINLNIKPGYLMGDPQYADSVCRPEAVCRGTSESELPVITDPAELGQLGFVLESWEYPDPIENRFSYGGVSMSSESVMFTTAIAFFALLAAMILIRKDPEITYSAMDKASAVLNFLVLFMALPPILVTGMLIEIVEDFSVLQQILYLTPALTVAGVAGSVILRRMGRKKAGLWSQFAGPVVFALMILLDAI